MAMDVLGPKGFAELVQSTAAERSKVRQLAATGRWQQAEKDTDRFRRYAGKRTLLRSKAGAEAIQGDTLDYQPASFLAEGAVARRAVAFVEVTFGTRSTVGSGFMVSPRLFLTNQHVIPNAQAALGATITFDRELDEVGRPRQTTAFALEPDAFALFSDEAELDYALVAVGARHSGVLELADFGFCPLSDAPDKHVIGMSTNIIQHPGGQRKLISIRKNLLVARTPRTLLYETDTEVGSSGSPVFNDDWEVVALHHYGEPFLEQVDAQGRRFPVEVNEGVRCSALVADLVRRGQELDQRQQRLLDEALVLGKQASAQSSPVSLGPPRPTTPAVLEPRPESLSHSTIKEHVMASPQPSGTLDVVIPLRISISVDAPATAQAATAVAVPRDAAAPVLGRSAEAIRIDTDYSRRGGYVGDFIPGAPVPLPKPIGETAAALAPLRAGEPNANEGELRYEHFSVKLNRSKRMAIFTATNIDGETYLSVDRKTGDVSGASEGETWFRDPRTSDGFSLGQDFYSEWSAYFDRGHLTRRTDPTWGSPEEARRANADTFHFSNCTPQHFRFNQTATYWQGIERYVLETGVLAQDSKRRLCVFQGPLFDDRIDRTANDVQIPSSFFKIVVWKGGAGLKAVGLVVDQGPLLDESRSSLGTPRAPGHVDVNHWRVPIATIERRAGLDFGKAVRDADTIGQAQQPAVGAEALQMQRINRLEDIAL